MRLVAIAYLSLFVAASVGNAYAEETWKGYETAPLNFRGEKLDDRDGDGVIDARDACENINADAVISNNGCAKDTDILAQTVLHIEFGSDDWRVDKKYYAELQRFATFYRQHPAGFITIEGHTDSTGNAEHNMKLSQFRAQAVVKLLTDQYGINKHKIHWVGYGETRPVSDNKTKEGRRKNRRIVAIIRAHELHEVRNWSVY